MGSKKAKKTTDPVTKERIAATPVHEPEVTEKKKKGKLKVKRASEIDGIIVEQKAPVEALEMTTVKTKAKPKATSEIDDIFGQRKRKKSEGEHDDAAAAADKKKEKASSEVVKLNSKGELVKPKKPKAAAAASASVKSTPAAAALSSRKRTEDGFTIYSAEELGFNKKNAGGSKLCPFDCDCCF